jgi:hypothetical protein
MAIQPRNRNLSLGRLSAPSAASYTWAELNRNGIKEAGAEPAFLIDSWIN